MTTWNYIKGSEKDFEGAPDWATKRIKGEWSGKQSFCGLRDRHVHICDIGETMGERMNMGYAHIVIAQRERVTGINDDRLLDSLNDFPLVSEKYPKHDNINHPLRYTKGDIECIDAIKAATVGKTGIEAVDVGHVIRYLWRYEEKDGLESVKKAECYIKHLIKELESNK